MCVLIPAAIKATFNNGFENPGLQYILDSIGSRLVHIKVRVANLGELETNYKKVSGNENPFYTTFNCVFNTDVLS